MHVPKVDISCKQGVRFIGYKWTQNDSPLHLVMLCKYDADEYYSLFLYTACKVPIASPLYNISPLFKNS